MDGKHKHKKRCSMPLAIREMQTKTLQDTTIHLSEWLKFRRLTILRADKDVEELEPSHTADKNAKWYSYPHPGKQFVNF